MHGHKIADRLVCRAQNEKYDNQSSLMGALFLLSRPKLKSIEIIIRQSDKDKFLMREFNKFFFTYISMLFGLNHFRVFLRTAGKTFDFHKRLQ